MPDWGRVKEEPDATLEGNGLPKPELWSRTESWKLSVGSTLTSGEDRNPLPPLLPPELNPAGDEMKDPSESLPKLPDEGESLPNLFESPNTGLGLKPVPDAEKSEDDVSDEEEKSAWGFGEKTLEGGCWSS